MNALGPIAHYRCNEFGHLCLDAHDPGALIPPPEMPPTDAQGTPSAPTFDLTQCQSNDSDGLLTPVSTLVGGIKALKSDPDRQIVVGAIVAPPTPYTVAWAPAASGGNVPGELGRRSSTPATRRRMTAASAIAAVRITQFVQAFGDNGTVVSICDASYADVLSPLTQKLVAQPSDGGGGTAISGFGGGGGTNVARVSRQPREWEDPPVPARAAPRARRVPPARARAAQMVPRRPAGAGRRWPTDCARAAGVTSAGTAPAAGASNFFWFCWRSGGGAHATAKADQKFGVAADYQAGDATPRSVFLARFQEVVMSVSPKLLPIRRRVRRVVLLPANIRLHISRRHHPRLMAEPDQLARPMMRRPARFKPDKARGPAKRKTPAACCV